MLFQLKHAETTGYNSEIQRLNNVLQAEIAKSEKLSNDVAQISNSYAQLQCQMQVSRFSVLDMRLEIILIYIAFV